MRPGKLRESRLQHAAGRIGDEIGAAHGLRILHVTDFHNRRSAFWLLHALCKSVSPDVVVCTGDLSGIGGPIERFLLSQWLGRFSCPSVLAPGNHDSKATSYAFAKAGGVLLTPKRVAELGGLRVWGYRDPNRTRLVIGPRYDPSLCERSARERAGDMAGLETPFVVAVHNELMVPRVPGSFPLVLSGHFHSARIRREAGTLYVRTGTTGGRSKYSDAMRSAVIDVDRRDFAPNAVWLNEVMDDRVKVTKADT